MTNSNRSVLCPGKKCFKLSGKTGIQFQNFPNLHPTSTIGLKSTSLPSVNTGCVFFKI